jgi:hypothetical protein|nr:MAG TPA: hypothetical protein [Caudoviricetes sp.]
MTITQERFLEHFAQRLVDNGFIRVNFRHAVVLEKRITISDGMDCNVHLSWLPKSWPVVKVQIRIGSILLPYDVTVGLLMDYAGGVDDLLAQLVRKTTEGFADIIIKQL